MKGKTRMKTLACSYLGATIAFVGFGLSATDMKVEIITFVLAFLFFLGFIILIASTRYSTLKRLIDFTRGLDIGYLPLVLGTWALGNGLTIKYGAILGAVLYVIALIILIIGLRKSSLEIREATLRGKG